MKHFLILLSIFAASRAFEFKYGMRAKFGRGDGYGTNYFYSIPLDAATAQAQGWVQKTRPDGWMPDLTDMYCEPGIALCAFYDDNGFIAGLMTATQKDKLVGGVYDNEVQGFTEWEDNGITYWTMTQFFVDEDYLCQDKETRAANRDTTTVLQQDHIYLTSFYGDLVQIPINEADVDPIWAKQGCISGMGLHYYYNVTNKVCTSETIAPWSIIYHEGKLICSLWLGMGGTYPDDMGTALERASSQIAKISFPDAPQCNIDNGVPGVTLHTYFVDNPADITCPK